MTEIAIVIAILALLLGGLTLTLSTQTQLRRIEETQRTLELAKEALVGFAMTRGRFPCPANPTIATGAANAGVERTTCTAPADRYGVLPWVTLGIPETDAWGRRFSYRVSSDFADPDNTTVGPVGGTPPDCPTNPPTDPSKPSFLLCSQGDLTAQTRNPADRSLRNLAQTLPAVIVSHGPNGVGARWPDGTVVTALPGAPPTGADETRNANSTSTTFIVRDFNDGAPGCDDTVAASSLCAFDDLVVWVGLPILMNRMVVSGKLPY